MDTVFAKKAFLFDLNGTLIDDMNFHNEAWYDILTNDLGASLSKEQVKKEMYGKNSELLIRIFGPNAFSEAEMEYWSIEKEKRYQKTYKEHLTPIRGLEQFLALAYARKIPMAIGSAAIPFNINFVLDGLNLQHYFQAIVSANDVTISKPHPETFLKGAELLQVPAQDCLVFEDAPKGVEAALNAGMQAVVLTTMHTREEFGHFPNIVAFASHYEELLPTMQNTV